MSLKYDHRCPLCDEPCSCPCSDASKCIHCGPQPGESDPDRDSEDFVGGDDFDVDDEDLDDDSDGHLFAEYAEEKRLDDRDRARDMNRSNRDPYK